ncbi:DegT/DnrJ/EryC1/StrS aminotransferase family protein [Bowmanella sp. JS7-9]|uniref:DegT/DnrJ/EryC1/StrS family aminotransferase n=1 Tax=Pseudobowmanella zhangzhouensis TaxID=1537679 RepID=A0ABW1XHU1_9ALTE|nr:DegT/DnrJ/EryC1/StrS family aminotransferase [Bowmanella sp. JS7-9]TBX25865.1 aminotransferase DegT [Bowmanella sp. JS7-9]
MQFIDLNAQLTRIRPQVDQAIARVLNHGKFISGPEVSELEKKLAEFTGVKHCISCANGTDALSLSLAALNLGPGDVIFTTAFSFFATAEVVPATGASVFFVDIDPLTYNLCPASLERAIKQVEAEAKLTPKAVIAVDLFGLPANYPVISQLCQTYQLRLIEDAAQGFGGAIGQQRSGGFGDIATTSFFPAKPLGCLGDGGAIFTNDDALAEVCRSLRIHGQGTDKYDNVRIGQNSRLDTIQAAILLEKLAIFEDELVSRQRVAQRYLMRLNDVVTCPIVPDGYYSAWAQFTIRVPASRRQEIMQMLSVQDIPSMVYYAKPLHLQTALLGSLQVDCTEAEIASESVLSLPMHPYLTDNEIDGICQAVIQTVAKSGQQV